MKPAVFVLLATSLLAAQATPPPTPRAQGTGLIVGQVVDGAGTPVSEAIVTLSSEGVEGARRVMADGSGRFFFTELAGREYWLLAEKSGYLVGRISQPRPDGPAAPIHLREGERRLDARIVIWKHAVITGVVLDDAGEPVVRGGVIALRRTYVGGRPTVVFYRQTTMTDDRGRYRFASLVPGDYLVAVPVTLTTTPAAMLRDYMEGQDRTALKGLVTATAQVYGASETSRPGDPRNLHVGEHVVATFGIMPTPPAARDDGRLIVYRTAMFQNALSPSRATLVTVSAGQERTGVDLDLTAAPAMRVSGRIVGPDGVPPGLIFVRLVPAGQDDSFTNRELEAANGTAEPSGAFTLHGVPPGAYTLKVAITRATPDAGGRPAPAEVLWAAEPVVVGDRDVADLEITLRRGLNVSGRVEFHGATTSPPATMAKLPVGLSAQATGSRSTSAATDEQGVFSVSVVPGSYLLEPPVLAGWWIRSITRRGQSLTHRLLEATDAQDDIVVSYTDRPSRVSGLVRTPRGTPAGMALVVALPEPDAGTGAPGMSGERTTRASQTGAYELAHLPPGNYVISAVDDSTSHFQLDPATLSRLSRAGIRVTIGDGLSRVLDLKLSELR